MEKILAAKMAHMEKVLVPDKNRPGYGGALPRRSPRALEIVYVKSMEDVLAGGHWRRRRLKMIIRDVNLETVCGNYRARLPENVLPEFAFAGQGPMWASPPLINGLMNRKSYAKTSSQPGKTQTINFLQHQPGPLFCGSAWLRLRQGAPVREGKVRER